MSQANPLELEYRQIRRVIKVLLLVGAILWSVSFYLYTYSLRDAARTLLERGPSIHETMGWR